MTDKQTMTADLRERIQHARAKEEQSVERARKSLDRLGYDLVRRGKRARVGQWIGYVLLIATGVLAGTALMTSIGLAVLAGRWVVGMF